MRVGMVSYSLYDHDARVMRYAETLAEEGHDVEVICLKHGGALAEEILHGVRVLHIQNRTRNEKSGADYFFKVMLFFFRALFALSTRHLRKPYKLIHAHSVPDFIVFTAIIPRLLGAKVILDIHDILPELFMSKFGGTWNSSPIRLLRLAEKISCLFSNHVIIANDIWREKLTLRSIVSSRCTTILNYPDERFGVETSSRREPNEVPIALYPGTLNYHQGIDIAFQAIALLKQRSINVLLHIYGQGPEVPNLITLRKELGIEHLVQINSMQPLDTIANIMRSATIGIVPKRAEGFGNEAFSTKIFEFLALGIPMVVSATTIDKFYFNESVVEFFESGNPVSLAAAMQRLLTDKELQNTRRANGLAFMKENRWDKKRRIYLDIVHNLAASGKDAHR